MNAPVRTSSRDGVEPARRYVDATLVADALWKHRLVMFLCVVLVPAAAVWARHVLGVKYKSSALVLVQEKVKLSQALKELNLDYQVSSRLPAITSLVKSSRSVERVLRDMGELHDDLTPAQRAGRIAGLKAGIQVYSEGGGLINISLSAGSAEFVSAGLVRLTAELMEELLRPEREALAKNVAFLDEQVVRVRGERRDLDDQLHRFREQNPNHDPEVQKLKIEGHRTFLSQLIKAESALAGATGGGATRSAGMSRAARRVQELREVYTPTHPEVLAAEAALRRARQRGGGGPSKAARDKKALKEQVEFLTRRVDASLEELRGFAALARQSNDLIAARDAKANLHQKLLERHEEAVVNRALVVQEKSTQIRVVESASKPQMSLKSRLFFVLLAGLVGGLVLGLVFVFALEFLDRTVRRPWEAEQLTGVPVLGTLPHFAEEELAARSAPT